MSMRDWICKTFGCNGSSTPPNPNPPGDSRPMLMCYFGVQDGQIASTHEHVNAAHIGSWGDWVTPAGRADLTRIILNYAREAVDAGIDRLIFSLDWCMLTQTNPRHRLPDDTAVQYLIQFCDAIRDAGLMQYVIGWYPCDEPNIQEVQLNAADCGWMCAHARNVTCHYTQGGNGNPANAKPMITTYAQRNGHYDGIEAFDWLGIDNYGNPIFENGMYAGLVSQLNSTQRTVILPGGSNPWREDPWYYYNHAQTDPRVAMIMPFAWFPEPDGIGFNGMQPQYNAVGDKILAAEEV